MSLPSPYTLPVYQAICDLAEESAKGTALRDDIVVRTGLVKSLVDEAVKRLVDDQLVVLRIKPGVFVPIHKNEESAVSFTILENSYVKLEKANQMMDFTPREWARFKRSLIVMS